MANLSLKISAPELSALIVDDEAFLEIKGKVIDQLGTQIARQITKADLGELLCRVDVIAEVKETIALFFRSHEFTQQVNTLIDRAIERRVEEVLRTEKHVSVIQGRLQIVVDEQLRTVVKARIGNLLK